jgi:hypothetical protein
MMSFGRTGARVARSTMQRTIGQNRPMSGIPSMLYQTIWRKSNILYITYVVAGCIVLEGVYGFATTSIWNTLNSGKLYHQIDWSKFKAIEDDDEEEEEEDE